MTLHRTAADRSHASAAPALRPRSMVGAAYRRNEHGAVSRDCGTGDLRNRPQPQDDGPALPDRRAQSNGDAFLGVLTRDAGIVGEAEIAELVEDGHIRPSRGEPLALNDHDELHSR